MCAQQASKWIHAIGTKIKCKIIDEALTNFNLGKLEGMYYKIHAYGITNNDELVWLPYAEGTEKPVHIFFPSDDKNLIFEQGEHLQEIIPDMGTAHVITRKGETGNYECEYIGKYKQILYDKENGFLVHVRVPCLSMKGSQIVMLWDYAFVLSEAEARKQLKKCQRIKKCKLKRRHAKVDK